ncbi:hypothetical protein [Synechocystis sp. PCC 7509]|uniref:hypothetical protein n=1 Tax=Synechocystis sp. PCC 7509 TaxID=927677 RepID=UPI00056E4C8E|nr:hypothetical protein [Synechocystis sp. PCC 7509]
MPVNYYQPNFCIVPVGQIDWANKTSCNLTLASDTWVHLLKLPNEYSYDEALLLCDLGADKWVAWIPNYGETVLDARDFYPT